MDQLLPNWIDGVAEDAHAIALSMLQEKGRGAVLVGAAQQLKPIQPRVVMHFSMSSMNETIHRP